MPHNKKSIKLNDAVSAYKAMTSTLVITFLDFFAKENIQEFYRSSILKKGFFTYENLKYSYRFHGNSLRFECINNSIDIDIPIFKNDGDFINDIEEIPINIYSFQNYLICQNIILLLDNSNNIIADMSQLKDHYDALYYYKIRDQLYNNS
jgi:hypothetical protein